LTLDLKAPFVSFMAQGGKPPYKRNARRGMSDKL